MNPRRRQNRRLDVRGGIIGGGGHHHLWAVAMAINERGIQPPLCL
jgi:hypothetical protein